MPLVHYRKASVAPLTYDPYAGFDADALAAIAAFSVSTDFTRESLYDDVITAMKGGSIDFFAKTRGFWLMAAHDAQAARVNLAVPAEVASAVNGPTFTTDRGYVGGSLKYLDTGINSATEIDPTNGCACAWNQAASAGTGYDFPMGYNFTSGLPQGGVRNSSLASLGGRWASGTSSIVSASLAAKDFYAIARSGTTQELHRNTAQIASATVSTISPSGNFDILSASAAGSADPGRYSAVWLGDYLTEAQRTELRSIVITNFLTPVGAY